MCGICGRVNAGQQPVSENVIREMAGVLVHRGPDQEGVHVQQKVGFGFRRLAVIDLETGDQPMYNADRSVVVVFNGEIYNFKTLRAELEKQGCCFQTESDTEVILHAYEVYGVDFVHRLRGMFAIALWDEARCRLVLARDRVGKKPLFYYRDDKGLVFASELKALLQDKQVPRRILPRALDRYLTYRYTAGHETIIEGVKQLPPAHWLTYSPADGAMHLERYWSPAKTNGTQTTAEEVDRALREAVQLRMVSDVPLGAFLSGGIDSSIVVAIMASISNAPIKTFSIGFEEDAFNELPYARLVAERYRTEHHEYIVRPDIEEVLPKLVWYADEPFGDASALPTYYVSKMARQEVTVALNGDGGDESFAGYRHYKAILRTLWYDQLPRGLRDYLVEPFLTALPSVGSVGRLQQMFRDVRQPLAVQYARRMMLMPADVRHELYTLDMVNQLTENADAFMVERFPDSTSRTALACITLADMLNLLPGDFLVKVDRMSMANSLEARSPFLDHKVIELAMGLPDKERMVWYGPGKQFLRKRYGHLLPDEILQRKKSGFSVPVDAWFRGPLQDLCWEVLLAPRTLQRGYFKPEVMRKLVDQHVRGIKNSGHRLWTLMMLELWFRQFIDGQSS